MEPVLFETARGIATITLNRPDTLNSMNAELMTGLGQALQRVVANEAVRVVVLTGAGKGFCSGADLTSIQDPSDASPGAPTDLGDLIANSMDHVFHPPIRALGALPVPTIAMVNGVAAGGGVGLALACDIVVAAKSAYFVATFGPRLGIVPDLGSTWQLSARVGRAKALGIAMLGDRISAEDAERWGLIWSVVEDAELRSEVDDLADRLARCSPQAMCRIRDAVDAASDSALDQHLDVEREHQRVLSRLNMAEGVAAFMEKRDPEFSPSR